MNRYEGTSALVIGGTSGFGLTTARMLLDEGGRVMVTGHSPAGVEAARRELPGGALAVVSDVSVVAELDALAERVRSDLGGIDLLFVNAGITRSVPLEGMDEGVYDEVFGVNAKGPYFAVQRLAPVVRDGGAVVLTTSVSDVKGQPMVSAYAASKAAVRSMTRTFARELLPRGIRVNAVSPGPIDTGILDRSLPADTVEPVKARMRENNPMHRFGRSDEVARAVLFLGFEATFTTGAELPVDGGVSQL